MTQGIMGNGGDGVASGSQEEQSRQMLPPNSITRYIPNRSIKPRQECQRPERVDRCVEKGMGMWGSVEPRADEEDSVEDIENKLDV